MFDLSAEIVTILLFGGLLLGVLIGWPFAFVTGAVALIVGFFVFGDRVFAILYTRLFALVHSYTLIAIPLFVFMGIMLERSGIADRMFQVLYLWLSGLRGGLAVITVLTGTILAACVAVVAASVSMLALAALPFMIKRGYDKALASGSVVAAGCLGILVPPSIMLVIYAPMAGISAGKLFMAAFFPGFLLATLYMGYIAIRCAIEPNIGPAMPPEERAVPFARKTIMLIKVLVPPAVVILSVLGAIFMGIAPPTEAAAIGALTATILAAIYGGLSWKALKETTLRTFRVCGMIFLIGGFSFAFVGVFGRAGGQDVVANVLLAAPGGRWGIFIATLGIIFILGFFIDWIGIIFIMIPIIAPLGPILGFDPLWFAMMIIVTLQTAFMTPPLAVGIFYLHAAAPPELGITMADIMRGCVPFIVLVLVGLGLFVAFPEIILWLPGKMIR